MIYDNLDRLIKGLAKELEATMNDQVEKVARKKLKEQVDETVYKSYTPSQYVRTGGLIQDSNIKSNVSAKGSDIELTVQSTRSEDGKDIAKIIETGRGYSWESSEIARSKMPRPFHAKTEEELASTGEHVQAIKNGLKQRGIDVI
ncbi:hypothetical protein WKH57_00850 [Niallia taxi]|uniref:hypothetical protein n=1 Tax=Niallia taxi TaxID=2499688 RepID=UPI003178F3A1